MSRDLSLSGFGVIMLLGGGGVLKENNNDFKEMIDLSKGFCV